MRNRTYTYRGWSLLAIVTAFGLAAGLTFGDLRLASSQTLILSANQVQEGTAIDGPDDPIWDRTTPVEVALSAQNIARPMGGTVRSVTARALHDGQRIYILLEWNDVTQNLSSQRPQDFRDGAAVAFPSVKGDTIPSFCMGQINALVNIWHWQADIDRRDGPATSTYPNMVSDGYQHQDEVTFRNPALAVGNILGEESRGSPVENLLAGGFGTLTTADAQIVDGAGRWRDGRWRVMFIRDLTASGSDLTQFTPGATISVNFAVWDGEVGERDGQKSVSQLIDLQLTGQPAEAAQNVDGRPTRLGVIFIIALVVLLGGVWYAVLFGRGRTRPS